ncbi:hypothetical protein [Aurantimonas sp. Leaf443]|uniref:hypothetical protein n=1 Tax=Aurantimonas sp. Leaf443 TaxID=1736378 RepID=UPI0012E3B65D|nr:hypothetical protein [Aurantimonas sp. Leaf443]
MLKFIALLTFAVICTPAQSQVPKTGTSVRGLTSEQLAGLEAKVKSVNPGVGTLSNVASGVDAQRSVIACGNIGKRPFLAIWDRRKNDWSTRPSKNQNEVFGTYITCAKNSIILPAYANFLNPKDFRARGGNYKLSPAQERLVRDGVSKELGVPVASLRGTAAFINAKKAVAVCGFASTSKGNIRFNGFLITDKRYQVAGVGRTPVEANAISYNCTKLYGMTLAGSL